MRQILAFLFLCGVCTLVHSNTIYRKYRELNVPVPVELKDAAINEQLLEKEIVAELKKDQIPVHIELVEPVVIVNKEEIVEPVESGRNVEVPVAVEEPAAPVVAQASPELIHVAEVIESVKSVEPAAEPKIEEPQPVESSRSVEAVVAEPAAVIVEPKVPAAIVELPESQAPILESVRTVEEKVAEGVVALVVVPDIPEPEVRNVEPAVAAEIVAVEPVVVPVEVEVPAAVVESVRQIEPVQVAEVLRKVEQIEEIAERQSEIINEIIAEEAVRSAEPVQTIENIIPLAVVPLPVVQNIIPAEPSVVEEVLLKEEERSIAPVEEVPEKIVPAEKVAESVVEIAKPKEEIAVRSVEALDEPKAENIKVEEKKEQIVKEEELKVKDESAVRAVDEQVVAVPKSDEKIEEPIVKEPEIESGEAVRQNADTTTPGNVIQQLLQNNPLTNFIQSIRPQSAAPTTLKTPSEGGSAADEATTIAPTPPNFIQQIATGFQGLQANVQGLFTGAGAGTSGSQTLSGTPAPSNPPFAFLTNLFPGQQPASQSTQTGAPTGGNVPPNPIQGFLGLFNGNRATAPPVSQSTTTTTKLTTKSPPLDDKIDELKGSDETIESNETFENEPEIYVGDEENSAQIY